MTDDEVETENARLFPSYKLGESEIAIKEYEFAAQTTAKDDALFTSTSAIIAIATPVLGSLVLGQNSSIRVFLQGPDQAAVNVAATLVIVAATYFSLAHLSNLRRSFVYAARKLIVVRRMLGQSYGPAQLVLPNWRLEGADIPHAIKMFPGWRARYLFPFYSVIALGSALASLTGTNAWWSFVHTGAATKPNWFADPLSLYVFVAFFALGIVAVRRMLFDDSEDFVLLAARVLAFVTGVRLTGKFEYTLYRARLGRAEAHRLNVDLSNLSKIALFREDRRFFEHGGISTRAIGRALYRRFRFGDRGGGSTITQQLARTLFIVRPRQSLRRKLVEIVLAIWLDRRVEKAELLEIYLTAVRFENGVFGAIAAMRYFFGKLRPKCSVSEAFVLVERISNVRSRFREPAIRRSISDAVAAGLMTKADASEAFALYEVLISKDLIRGGP